MATLIVVTAALAYRTVFLVQLRTLWELEDRQARLELRIGEMDRALALSERIEKQYEAYEAVIAQKGDTLDEEIIAFEKTISDITKANEMKPYDQARIPTEQSQHYSIFAMRAGYRTRPIWLARFLAALERGSDLIRVEDITVKALDDDENLSVNMKLSKIVAAEKRAAP